MHRSLTVCARTLVIAGVAFALAACGGHGSGAAGGVLPSGSPNAASALSSMISPNAKTVPCFYPAPCPLTEYPVPTVNPATGTSYPNSITSGPDGNLWFTEWDGNKVAKITTSGTITEYANGITANSDPSIIRVGPDKNLWFTESNGSPPNCTRSAVARVTTSGVVTEFSNGIDPCADPYGITGGPDGNIWFIAAFDGQGLYKLPPSATASTSATLVGNAMPNAQSNNLIVGPDGNLWWTEVGGAIGTYSFATGKVTEYPVPSPNSQPYDIVNGPAGTNTMWFTEYAGDSIGSVTTSGVVTEYNTGITPGSGPNGLTLASDGNLWFVEANTNALADINPLNPGAGSHEYAIPATTINGGNPGPLFITTGPDGNLWFTEYANAIAKINPLTIVATWTPVGSTATPGPSPAPTPCESDKDDAHQKPGHDNHDHEINKPWKDCRIKTKPPHHNDKK